MNSLPAPARSAGGALVGAAAARVSRRGSSLGLAEGLSAMRWSSASALGVALVLFLVVGELGIGRRVGLGVVLGDCAERGVLGGGRSAPAPKTGRRFTAALGVRFSYVRPKLAAFFRAGSATARWPAATTPRTRAGRACE